jgi:hypothetical protein
MKFSCILVRKERKNMCKVCKRWPCNGHHEHLKILSKCGRNLLTIEGAFLDKGILEKLKGEGTALAFYTATNKSKP